MRRLLAHLVGDYVVQSDWMAAAKVLGSDHDRRSAATLHAAFYTLCHVPLTRNPLRLAVIGGTHWALDRYRPLPRLINAKDIILSPVYWPATMKDPVPFWLHIVVDNTVHLLINEIALSAWKK